MPEQISYVEHAQDVLKKAAELIVRNERFVLVTSVAIKGGTARELGSLALVTETGQMVGYLSNGCIDQDIRLNALSSLETNKSRFVHYGDGSPFRDLTLPCGGMLKVLLDPTPDVNALSAAYRSLKARRPARLTFQRERGSSDLCMEYDPKPRVMLAGRGAVFRSTATLAHSSGFEVSCLSPDEDDLAAVTYLCAEPPTHLVSSTSEQAMHLDQWSAFLTLFHDHSWEPSLLMAALKSPSRFIGALGSTRTHAARLGVLRDMGCESSDLQRIHGPVGLVSSLRSADLIAVSVIAECSSYFARSQRELPGSASCRSMDTVATANAH